MGGSVGLAGALLIRSDKSVRLDCHRILQLPVHDLRRCCVVTFGQTIRLRRLMVRVVGAVHNHCDFAHIRLTSLDPLGGQFQITALDDDFSASDSRSVLTISRTTDLPAVKHIARIQRGGNSILRGYLSRNCLIALQICLISRGIIPTKSLLQVTPVLQVTPIIGNLILIRILSNFYQKIEGVKRSIIGIKCPSLIYITVFYRRRIRFRHRTSLRQTP